MPKRSKSSKLFVKPLPTSLLLHVAKTAVVRGGEIAAKSFHSFHRSSATYKKNQELVTDHDLRIEKLIRHTIKQHFPEHQINGEEQGTTGRANRYLWQIDPIDGTTNFVIHHPLFAISLGVQCAGQPYIGVVYIPMLKELYWAVAGQGAYGGTKRIELSAEKKLSQAIIDFEFSHEIKHNRQTLAWMTDWKWAKIKCRSLGSTAISACYVASGKLDAAILSQVMPWDLAAGGLILREAGGSLTDHQGNTELRYDRPVIISNGLLQQQILQRIKK